MGVYQNDSLSKCNCLKMIIYYIVKPPLLTSFYSFLASFPCFYGLLPSKLEKTTSLQIQYDKHYHFATYQYDKHYHFEIYQYDKSL